MKLGKPVDLVDLSQRSKFTELILKGGGKYMDDLWEEIYAEKELVERILQELEAALQSQDRVWQTFYVEVASAYQTLRQ